MKVELPGESKSFADITAGECFAFTRKQVGPDMYAPGFLIKTPTGQPLIAVKGLEREHGIPLIDVEAGKASGIKTDNLAFFTSWRIVTKVLDKYETVCSFPSDNDN